MTIGWKDIAVMVVMVVALNVWQARKTLKRRRARRDG